MRYLIAVLFFCTATAQAQACTSWLGCGLKHLKGEAAFEEVARFERQQQEEVLNNFKGHKAEILQRLLAYKTQVSKQAYAQTLRLCWAYREAMGLKAPHPEKFEYQGGGGNLSRYNLSDSVKAWGEIYAHGAYQTLDGISGLKAHLIEIRGLGFFDFGSWFQSMYAMSLISSTGFFYAAAHCLNTVSAREIQRFASAILIVDYEGTLTSQVALNLSLAKLIGFIRGPLNQWFWQPLTSVFARVQKRFGKPTLVIGGLSTGLIVGDHLACQFTRMEAAQANLAEYFKQNGQAEHSPSERLHIAFKLAQYFKTYQMACREISSGETPCQVAKQNFIAAVQRLNFYIQLSDYKNDLQQIRSVTKAAKDLERRLRVCGGVQNNESDLQQDYLDILEILIPVVEKLAL